MFQLKGYSIDNSISSLSNIIFQFEQTPLILASYEGNYEIVCYLIGLKGDGNIPLCSINAVDEV